MFSWKEIPEPKRFRLSIRMALIIAAAVGGFAISVLLEEHHYYWALLPGVAVFLASAGEFVLADLVTDARFPPETSAAIAKLEANLKGYHDRIQTPIQRVIEALRGCDRTAVSGTFHLLVNVYPSGSMSQESALIQIVDYSGALGGRKWRETPTTKGLIGRCVRTGCFEVVNFASREEYDERMVTEFGFSRGEVQAHTRAARSYCAHPVLLGNALIGVIYLFSTERQVFPRALEAGIIEAAAREISAFLEGARIVSAA
jgi:hypothetical protein